MKNHKEIIWIFSYYWTSVFKSLCSHCQELCNCYNELVYKC